MTRWMLTAWIVWLALVSAVSQVPDQISQRPPSSHPTPVQVGLYYIDISDIDGAAETYTATAYLLLRWNDPRLRFKPEKTGETGETGKVLFYKPESIWTPAAEIINAQKLDDQIPPMCAVTADGTVYYSRRVVILLNTQMDLRRFPFDREPLRCMIESSLYGSHDVIFMTDPDQSGLGGDMVSRGWSYTPLSWKVWDQPFANTQQNYSRLVFTLDAKRNATYFIWKIIFPTLIFVLLTWAIFWIPVHEVQTALLVSVTILLTAVAFGNVTDSLLPKLGYRTWLDQFQLGSFLFIAASIVETITVFGMNLGGSSFRAEKVRKILRISYPISYALFCLILFAIVFI